MKPQFRFTPALLPWIFLFLYLISGCKKNSPVQWEIDKANALVRSEKEQKPILINFSDCIDCSESIEKSELFLKEYSASERFILLHLSPKSPEWSDLMSDDRYKNLIRPGLTFAIINSSDEIIGEAYGADGLKKMILQFDKNGSYR